MNTPTLASLSLALLLAASHSAFAQDDVSSPPPRNADAPAQRLNQVLYKGVVGNLLDAVPMESEQRTTLQRTNAVVSGALSGKSLATLAKIAHPGFLIGGLVWGLWAAANIEQTPGNAPSGEMTLLATSTQADVAGTMSDTTSLAITVEPVAGRASVAPVAAQHITGLPALSQRPKVVRIWLAPSAY